LQNRSANCFDITTVRLESGGRLVKRSRSWMMLVAMIAIARKVIILEVNELEPLTLIGIAGIILALAMGYIW